MLGHSYSAKYFNNKFESENIPARYDLYPLESIDMLPELIRSHPHLSGLNVTIPYKVDAVRYLDTLSEEAESIGAVNVIKIIRTPEGIFLKGFNSDAYGFMEAMKPLVRAAGITADTDSREPTALVLGTGGASRAVIWSLRKLGFTPQSVGRRSKENCMAYEELTPELIHDAGAVVNCTPLGTSPDTNKAAPFPYQYLHKGQICFDLVYNPAETLFMRICKAHGCMVSNGLEMLRLQAEGAWKIWTSE
mgnify:CR=1 FL=1